MMMIAVYGSSSVNVTHSDLDERTYVTSPILAPSRVDDVGLTPEGKFLATAEEIL